MERGIWVRIVGFFTIVGALSALFMLPEVRRAFRLEETQQASSQAIPASTPIMSKPAATPNILGLFVGESYKFPDADAVYYYDNDQMLHRGAAGPTFFRIYTGPEARSDRCPTGQLIPSAIHKTPPILKGSVSER